MKQPQKITAATVLIALISALINYLVQPPVTHTTAATHPAKTATTAPSTGPVPIVPATPTTQDFADCRQFFANGRAPVVAPQPTNRALCYEAFAILHSGQSKTPVFVAERLNRATVADAGEKRTDKFFADARLREAERADLEDYKDSGYDRGHMAPAGDMPNPTAMAQSFSLANMAPQAPELNRGIWSQSVEGATRDYVRRAQGNVYVITGPVYSPSIAKSKSIGPGKVRVPASFYKLVYDQAENRAWVHWYRNRNEERSSAPISYAELVKRTNIEFLPGIQPKD